MSVTASSLGSMFVSIGAKTAQYERSLSRIAKKTENTTKGISKAFIKTSAVVAAASTAIGAVSVREFAKFDEAMTKSTSIMSGVNATVRKEMEATARTISTQTRTSAVELGESYYYLASAGYDAQQSISALGTVERFATAGAFDMAKATDLLTDAQSALGLSTKDATQNQENLLRVSDVLIKANTLANASAEQFAKSLTTKSAAALRLLNKDVEEGVAVLAAYADQGTKGELAGERLAIMLRDLQTASLKFTDDWEAMGLSVFDAQGKMLPIVNIIEQLEGKLLGATDKQKKMTLATLGFTDRSQNAITSLLGMSGQIAEYEKNLRNAAGTTETVASNQLEAFNAQMEIAWNQLKNVAITIGEELAPVLTTLLELMRQSNEETEGWSDVTEGLAYILKGALLTGVTVIADTIYGLNLLLNAGRIAFINLQKVAYFVYKFLKVSFTGLTAIVEQSIDGWHLLGLGLQALFLKVSAGAANLINAGLKPVTEAINKVIVALNRVSGKDIKPIKLFQLDTATIEKDLNDTWAKINQINSQQNASTGAVLKETQELNQFLNDIETGADVFSQASEEYVGNIIKMYDEGRPSERFLAALDETEKKLRGANDTAQKAGASIASAANNGETSVKGLSSSIEEASYNMEGLEEEAAKLREDLKDPFLDAMESAARYNAMLEKGLLTQEEYSKAIAVAMGTETAEAQLPSRDSFFQQQTTQTAFDPFSMVGPAEEMMQYEQSLQESYDRQRMMILNNEKLNEETKLSMMEAANKKYIDGMKAYGEASNAMMISTAQNSIGQLMNVLESAGKEQSGLYKTLFAMQQAFGIVQTIINTEIAAAQALVAFGPIAGPAMSGVIRALGYASVGIIAGQTIASFEGGGMTPSGPRTGGMDGKGGFLAMMHPDEKVTDLTKENAAGAGSDLTININNFTDVDISTTEKETDKGTQVDVDIRYKEFRDRLTNDLHDKGNSFSRTIQQMVLTGGKT